MVSPLFFLCFGSVLRVLLGTRHAFLMSSVVGIVLLLLSQCWNHNLTFFWIYIYISFFVCVRVCLFADALRLSGDFP